MIHLKSIEHLEVPNLQPHFVFSLGKTFDVNIGIIVNFVLVVKTSNMGEGRNRQSLVFGSVLFILTPHISWKAMV